MKLIILLITLLILQGCAVNQKNDPAILITTDQAFSRMSTEKGLNAAFIFYAADSTVIMRDGKLPIIGKNEMTRIYMARPDTGMILKWNPVRADISQSDDLGYTFGDWELYLKDKDTTLYGNYVSVWKKQADGSWKFILDTGVNTPKPQ
jgi:ketosteroid isomerase-like protein